MLGLLVAQTPDALEAIRTAARDEAARHPHAGGFELPMPPVLASGVKASG